MAEYFPIDVNYKSYSGSFSGSFFGDGSGITGVSAFPAGPNKSVQFNDNNVSSGSGNFTFDKNTNTLTLTGSLNITGSTTQVGNNTLLGNTLLTGSIIISGSNPPGSTTASVQIYGDIRQSGYHRFDPVNTNIDTSISASYIYVSGSTQDLYFSQNGSGYTNVTRLRWLEGNLYTGLLHGGLITATTGSTTFNISSGSGIIVNLNASINDDPYPTIQYVNWGNFINQTITYRTSSIQTFLGIDSNGQIIQQVIPWSDGQYNTSISLGTVLHQNQSTVNATITYPNVAYGYKQRTYDFIKAFGPLKLSGYALNTSSSLGLTINSGTAFADGRNYQTDPNNPSYITDAGTTVSKIFRYYQSGSSFVQDTNAGVGYTGIDTTQYNPNGNGVLTSVSPSKFYVHRIFWYPNSATKGIVDYYGLDEYGTLDEAQADYTNEPFIETPNTQQNAIFLGVIIIKGNSNFNNVNDYRLVQASLFRAAGTGGGGGGGGTTSPGGLATQIQYNDGGLFNGVPTLTYNGTTLNATGSFSGSLTGSLFGTSSWATNALTASFINTASTNAFVQNGNSFGATALLGTNDNQSLAFETSGSTRMFISSSGNVGVGTTSPAYGIHHVGTIGSAGIFSQRDFGAGAFAQISQRSSFIGYTTDGTSGIAIGATSGTARIQGFLNLPATTSTLLSLQPLGGNVSIGTIINSALLQVRGSGATSTTTTLRVENTNASASLVVLDNGQIGVGTTLPSASITLDVSGSTRTNNFRLNDNSLIATQYTTGGTTLTVLNTGHNNAVGINVTSATGIRAASNLGVSANNLTGASIYAAGGTSGANISLGLLSNRALITSAASGMAMHTSSMLQVDSTIQGFLPPRTNLTSNIATPAQGLITYLTGSTNEGLYYYNSGSQTGWHRVLTNTGSQSITGSLNVNNGITGSLFGSSSYALNAATASFLLGSITSASYAATASLLTGRLSTYRSFGTGSTVGTGTTSLVATTSFLIPANTFVTGDILRVRYRVRKLATNANTTTGIYINTTNDISTATTLGILTANTTLMQMKRDFYILAATGINTEHVGVGTSLATDDTSTGRAASTINWAVDQYIIFGITHTNTNDSGYSTMYYLERV